MGRGAERTFNEYDAWLQPGCVRSIGAVRLEAPAGAGRFALEECALGLERIYGPAAVSGGAAYAVSLGLDAALLREGYRLRGGDSGLTVTGGSPSGLLYGVYALLARLGAGKRPCEIKEQSAPAVPWRVLNHWDELDGSVERGYAGRSLFFDCGRFSYDPKRILDYARLLASVGINAVAVNNVNVDADGARLITEEFLPAVASLASIFRPFGIRIALAVHFESPVLLGGLPTADPLDAGVRRWWREKADEVYRHVPDLAGFLVKADSEFRSGPMEHGRTQADGANALADALVRHGGVVFWRCFVYNCRQDWRDGSTDRPKAAYEHFKPLDGLFAPNVLLQVKFGPSDFQVREPLSPLLGAMPQTCEALELQITQEYTGQQIDLYALAVQWEEIFRSPVDKACMLKDCIGGGIGAVCGVANTGADNNWTGHLLAQANLFAFGRMAWDPSLSAGDVLYEWAELTFGADNRAVGAIADMLLRSRGVYESYTAPLGIGWMVNPGHHYGPSVDGYEYARWGTYHRAGHDAVGVDRTSRGTGFTRQYAPEIAAMYDDAETCPEELLLYFHRLNYTHRLKSGKTLMQHIYDTHFEGVAQVEELIRLWESLRDELPEAAYQPVRERLSLQLANATEWRDVINSYFYRKTGIPDAHNRAIF